MDALVVLTVIFATPWLGVRAIRRGISRRQWAVIPLAVIPAVALLVLGPLTVHVHLAALGGSLEKEARKAFFPSSTLIVLYVWLGIGSLVVLRRAKSVESELGEIDE